jgi:hypothetical protein
MIALPLDLKKYGINLTLTNTITIEDIHSAELAELTQVSAGGGGPSLFQRLKKYNITMGGITYNEERVVGSGSEGSVSLCKDPAGKSVAIKRVPNKDPITKSVVIIEAILQIILYETTKSLPDGPYVPELYSIATGGSLSIQGTTYDAWYICTEWMEGTLEEECYGKSPEEIEPILKEALSQLVPKLSWLDTNLRFNHRDFGSSNVMYKVVDGKKQYRLVDFGASCMELDVGSEKPLVLSVSPFYDFTNCFKPNRDIAHLLYELIKKYTLTPRLDALFKKHLRSVKDGANISFNTSRNAHGLFNSESYTFPDLNPIELLRDLSSSVGGARTRKRNYRRRSRKMRRR